MGSQVEQMLEVTKEKKRCHQVSLDIRANEKQIKPTTPVNMKLSSSRTTYWNWNDLIPILKKISPKGKTNSYLLNRTRRNRLTFFFEESMLVLSYNIYKSKNDRECISEDGRNNDLNNQFYYSSTILVEILPIEDTLLHLQAQGTCVASFSWFKDLNIVQIVENHVLHTCHMISVFSTIGNIGPALNIFWKFPPVAYLTLFHVWDLFTKSYIHPMIRSSLAMWELQTARVKYKCFVAWRLAHEPSDFLPTCNTVSIVSLILTMKCEAAILEELVSDGTRTRSEGAIFMKMKVTIPFVTLV